MQQHKPSKTFTITWAELEAHVLRGRPLPSPIDWAYRERVSVFNYIHFGVGPVHYRMEYAPGGSPRLCKLVTKSVQVWEDCNTAKER